ncbi:uncharacterized protein E0L32_011924 [Thyridium curvatum]|uniref:Uncharacterized protein n=1 Tax=Thyridium curvatum TaxID=1093900 RepID=A0A507BEW4_9PEZI|nr:uncharacterized protein E0L32_011924 [Thyridium curvatum]TPX18013.1 hypothetical protein E0L32_011924 [Thyridium curvatum]
MLSSPAIPDPHHRESVWRALREALHDGALHNCEPGVRWLQDLDLLAERIAQTVLEVDGGPKPSDEHHRTHGHLARAYLVLHELDHFEYDRLEDILEVSGLRGTED